MKKPMVLLGILFVSVTSLMACTTPHQPLKVHSTPGQPQKPNGCVMQAGYCKPANT